MEFFLSLIGFLQKAVFSAGPFFLLLGVLIFIHELGHFLVARLFGVRVEVFSLGFGPKLLKYKRGDTVYCISALPLGGYVKMFGDNPLEEIPDREKSQGFLYKKPGQKWLIAFAGPFMNLVFAFFALFALATCQGISILPPVLGDIQENSAAHRAGFRTGDRVLSLGADPISSFQAMDKIIQKSAGKKLSFKLKTLDQRERLVTIEPKEIKNPNPLEWTRSIGSIEGLQPFSLGLKIGVIHGKGADEAGLKSFDKIIEFKGSKIRYWRQLEELFQKTPQGKSFSLKVEREGEKSPLSFKLLKSSPKLHLLGIEPAELYIVRLGPDTPAKQAGLLIGDRLVSIDGKRLKSFQELLKKVQAYSSDKPLSIDYLRKGEKKTVEIKPRPLFVEENLKKRFMIGIVSGGEMALPEDLRQKHSLLEATNYSIKESFRWLNVFALFFVRLAQSEISFRTLGGPVAIGRAAHRSYQLGWSVFLFMMAVISLNLCFLNLLPIPMLDGGHLLFFSLEGLLGRPLNVRHLLIAQQAGLLFLLSFMGFAFYNDIYNWLKAW